MSRLRPKIVVAANDSWNIVNYRAGLIRALQSAGFEVTVLAPDGPHRGAIESMGAAFRVVPMSPRGTSPTQDLGVVAKYVKVLREIRPAAFLGFTAKPNIYGSIAARICGVPVINNISGLGSVFTRQSLLTRLVAALYKIALRRSVTVFFQNRDDQALFERMGLVRPDQGGLLPGSGVDVAHFAPRCRAERSGPFTFLLAARLLWDKGVAEYVEATRRLKSPSVRFRILGLIEPPGVSAVSPEKLSEWETAGLVEYLGSADDVRPVLAEADCVVLPSYYREGVPRVLLEASSMAIPVITTDAPGCRQAVDDGVTGFLCEPRSVTSLVAAMEQMMQLSPKAQAVMGSAARKKMEREFREEIVHRAYLEALARVGIRER